MDVSEKLKRLIADAPSDARLRILAHLHADPVPPRPHVRPNAFADGASYRQALLDARTEAVGRATERARSALEELGLEVLGGEASAAVVLEGGAEALARALEAPDLLDGAFVDESLSLFSPWLESQCVTDDGDD